MVPIPVREVSLDFDSAIPSHWFGDNAYGSAFLDALSLLIPVGERFFIRSVQRCEGEVTHPALREGVRGFTGQEAAHSRVHGAHVAHLSRRGLPVRTIIAMQERHYQFIEKWFSARFCLAITAAMEHFTAVVGAFTLSTRCHDRYHPAMRDLWYWHAAEEIEHKSVAFDVLQTRAPKNYPLRAGAYLFATALLLYHVRKALVMFMRAEGIGRRGKLRSFRAFLRILPPGTPGRLLREHMVYLRPGFHPDQTDDRKLATQYFASRQST